MTAMLLVKTPNPTFNSAFSVLWEKVFVPIVCVCVCVCMCVCMCVCVCVCVCVLEFSVQLHVIANVLPRSVAQRAHLLAGAIASVFPT